MELFWLVVLVVALIVIVCYLWIGVGVALKITANDTGKPEATYSSFVDKRLGPLGAFVLITLFWPGAIRMWKDNCLG